MRLAQIRIDEDQICRQLFDLFMSGATTLEPRQLTTGVLDGRLSKSQLANLEEIAGTPHFKQLLESIEGSASAQWISFLDNPLAETAVPEPWLSGDDSSTTNDNARQLKKMIILGIMRPDRLVAACEIFVQKVLGEEIMNSNQVDLMNFVGENGNPKSPLLLVSAPGYDASYRVDSLAKQANKKYTSVAIGSPEAFG